MKNKLEFEVDGLKLCAKKPTFKQKRMGDAVYSRAFADALKNGAILKEALKDYMVQQNITSLEKQKTILSLLKSIEENTKRLEDPELKPEDGEAIANQIKMDRLTVYVNRLAEVNMENNTVEGLAENERFNYYVSTCILKEDGSPYFKDLEDYYSQAEDEIGITAASKLAVLINDYEEDYEKKLPESIYLAKLAKQNTDTPEEAPAVETPNSDTTETQN